MNMDDVVKILDSHQKCLRHQNEYMKLATSINRDQTKLNDAYTEAITELREEVQILHQRLEKCDCGS